MQNVVSLKPHQMRNIFLVLMGIIMIGQACDDVEDEIFDVTQEGLHYKFHQVNENAIRAEVGDEITYSIVMRKRDSVLFSSYDVGEHKKRNMPLTPKQNPILQAFKMMGLHDSITLALLVDSLPKRMTKKFRSGDTMLVDLKILEIHKKQEVDKKIAQMQKKAERVHKHLQEHIKEYLRGDADYLSTKSGLRYIIEQEGDGRLPQKGKKVDIHFAGFLNNGEEFISSFRKGESVSFPIGKGYVVKGLDEGLSLLKEGGKAILFIPPELGYGEKGYAPNIPGQAELVIYVEMLKVYQ